MQKICYHKKHGLTKRSPLVQETIENTNEANTEADEDNESQPKANKKQKLGIDYFNNQESDPKKSGALSKLIDILFPVVLIYMVLDFSTELCPCRSIIYPSEFYHVYDFRYPYFLLS